MKTRCLIFPFRQFLPARGTAACALALLAMAGEACAAIDAFIKFEGIPGEIADGRFAGWSPVISLGAQATVPPIIPPATDPGNTVFGFSVRKSCDKTTPQIAERVATGLIVPRVTLALMDGLSPVLRITLLDVQVSACSIAGGASQPVEEVSFTYQKIEWSNTDREGGGQTATFDVAANLGSSKPRLPFRASFERSPADSSLHVTCPVESGHRYRVRSNTSLDGAWQTVSEFTATEDGTMDQVIRISGNTLFLRVEEME
ncbi:MAG: type VI secretion system tube protein Hcp [Verrucomicrobiota bacterium]